jgi:hypothetical protein
MSVRNVVAVTALTLSTLLLRSFFKIAGFYADWIYFVFLKIVLDFTTIEIYDIVSHVVLTQRYGPSLCFCLLRISSGTNTTKIIHKNVLQVPITHTSVVCCFQFHPVTFHG